MIKLNKLELGWELTTDEIVPLCKTCRGPLGTNFFMETKTKSFFCERCIKKLQCKNTQSNQIEYFNITHVVKK